MDILQQLRLANIKRLPEFPHVGRNHFDDWSEMEWACCVAGETGELCNLVKKDRRDGNINIEDIGREAADIVCYLDILCQKYGLDLGFAVVNKFNEVSEKIKSDVKIFYY